MPADLRRASILERIQRDGGASTAELAHDYGVSQITVHRDLERLARDGLIERVHGGARPPGSGPRQLRVPRDWTKRLEQALPEKEAIAARAARFIEDGSTIFVDSSKFGLSALLAIARPDELDALVVDDGLPRETIDAYEAAGVNLVLAAGQKTAASTP